MIKLSSLQLSLLYSSLGMPGPCCPRLCKTISFVGAWGYSPLKAAEGEQILLELDKHVIILIVTPQQA